MKTIGLRTLIQQTLIIISAAFSLGACGVEHNSHAHQKIKSTAYAQSSIAIACEMPGDLNGDKNVDIRDSIKLVGCLVNDECLSALTDCSNDINADGNINVNDLLTLIGLIQNENDENANAEDQILQQVWCSGSLAEQHIVLPASFMPGGNVVAYSL
jgi:hypothetical protein